MQDSSVPDPHTVDLVAAVQFGYYDRVVELIESDSNRAWKSMSSSITLLHWAAVNNRLDIAQYLLDRGVEIDAYGGTLNSTPLHWAVRSGRLQMVALLVSRQAQPSACDGDGFTPLHLASMFGHTDIVAYLIAKGQPVDLVDRLGMTPLMHAADQITSREPTQLLIRLGAQINYQNSANGYTPLHYAVLALNEQAIRLLVDAGAKTEIRNSHNESPHDLIKNHVQYQHLSPLLLPYRCSRSTLPACLQVRGAHRSFGTKSLPYVIIPIVALILQINLSWIYKCALVVGSALLVKVATMMFFDKNVDRYLPVAIAQGSIFWLYVTYVYCFLPYVRVLSWPFVGVVVCTYFSWTYYHLAQTTDPGVIAHDREQQDRNIIQLVERNLFTSENFCTWCLVRRPLRSKHCRVCKRCVARFDHHCPWIDNCVGANNLRYFTGFLVFTAVCLGYYLHGAYLFYRQHCRLSESQDPADALTQLVLCSPAVLWLTAIAVLHTIWISGLCITNFIQIATGYTTNETFNASRYTYLPKKGPSPFSFGWIQNAVNLINRRVIGYAPIDLDWKRLYSLEDFQRSVPLRLRHKIDRPGRNPSMQLLNI